MALYFEQNYSAGKKRVGGEKRCLEQPLGFVTDIYNIYGVNLWSLESSVQNLGDDQKEDIFLYGTPLNELKPFIECFEI